MRFTMAPGAVSVIEEVVGGVVVGGVVVGGVVVGGVVVGGVVVGGVVVGGVVVVEPVLVLIVLAGGAVAAAAGVVVTLLPPQPARPADSALVTNRIIGREQISLKTSYIAFSPCKAIGPAFIWNACGGTSRSVDSTCVRPRAASDPRQARLWLPTFNFVEMSWFTHMDLYSELTARAAVAAVGMDSMTARNDIARSMLDRPS
jgi:hypothetical protein